MVHTKQKDISLLFNQAAQRYDAANDVMSVGLHRMWKKFFVRSLPVRPKTTWVDVGTGTGDIAIALHQAYPRHALRISACDPNEHMLKIARNKAWDQGICSIAWHKAPGQNLPYPDQSVHGVLMSFSLRNIVQWKEALQDALRCTKPGGVMRIMEFNALGPTKHAFFYEYYRKHLVPLFGALASGHKTPYTYLSESIRAFAPPKDIIFAIKNCGWSAVQAFPIFGGAVIIYQGEKP